MNPYGDSPLGGKFKDGFLGAAVGAMSGFVPGVDSLNGPGKFAVHTVAGGTAAAAGGGKFANGAYTAAFHYLFNEAAGAAQKAIQKYKNLRIIAAYKSSISRENVESALRDLAIAGGVLAGGAVQGAIPGSPYQFKKIVSDAGDIFYNAVTHEGVPLFPGNLQTGVPGVVSIGKYLTGIHVTANSYNVLQRIHIVAEYDKPTWFGLSSKTQTLRYSSQRRYDGFESAKKWQNIFQKETNNAYASWVK